MTDADNLKVIDTKDSLTVDELHELKKLAAMSKTARIVIAAVIGIIMLFGGDRIINLLQTHFGATH